MNEQDAWKREVMSKLTDSQTWEIIKDKPIQERVSKILELYGRMYQQPNNPLEIIGKVAGTMINNVPSMDLTNLEKKQGKDFLISVIDLVENHFEETIIKEIKSVKKEIGR